MRPPSGSRGDGFRHRWDKDTCAVRQSRWFEYYLGVNEKVCLLGKKLPRSVNRENYF